jgi:hypothetical protein
LFDLASNEPVRVKRVFVTTLKSRSPTDRQTGCVGWLVGWRANQKQQQPTNEGDDSDIGQQHRANDGRGFFFEVSKATIRQNKPTFFAVMTHCRLQFHKVSVTIKS